MVDGILQGLGALQDLADLVFQDLRIKQLLGVLPFVQSLGFVEPFVTLQPDQLHAQRVGQHLAQLGLPHSRRSLDQKRFLQRRAQVDHRGDVLVAQVLLRAQAGDHFVNRLKHGCPFRIYRS